MPTVIDSFVVTLGLDPAKFTQGQKDAIVAFKKTQEESEKSAKAIESQWGKASDTFSKVKSAALSMATVLLAGMGIKQFTEHITTTDKAIGRLSKNIEVGTKDLSAWQGLAKRFGSSAEDIDNAFRNTMKLVQQIQHGESPEALTWLGRAGVDLAKFLDATTTTEERLKMVQAAFAGTTAAEAQYYGNMMGYSEQTVNMLRETHGQMESLLRTQKELNSVSAEDVEAANKRGKAYADLTDKMEKNGRAFLTWITPALTFDPDKWISDKLSGLMGGSSMTGKQPGAAGAAGGVVRVKPADAASAGSDSKAGKAKPAAGAGSDGGSDISRLQRMGWTKEQAAGIAANIQAESGGDHKIKGDGGKAYGLAQWHPDRQANFKKWSGKDIRESSRDEQLAFLNYELRQGTEQKAGMALMNAKTAQEAGAVVSSQYERPADPAEAGKRADAAYRMMMAESGSRGSSGGSISIGEINISTQATDAAGIARDIGPALRTYAGVLPGSSGLR